MKTTVPHLLTTSLALIASAVVFQACTKISEEPGKPKKEKVSFVEDIRPILEENCLSCHHTGTLLGELNLENKEFASKKTPRGYFLVAGDPQASRLYNVLVNLRARDDAMPPDGHRLESEKINLIHDWIMQGAEWPDGEDGLLIPLNPQES